MNVLKTFYGRLSLLFLAVVGVLGLGIYALVAPAFVSFLCETEQRVHFGLAAEIANDIEPHLRDGIDRPAVVDRIEYLTGINPRIDIYLLGPDGGVRAYFAREDRTLANTVLDTRPLDAFLAGEALPIWVDDPMSPRERRPFSVAPITIMGEPDHYVLVVLGSDRYYTVAGALRHSYIMQGSLRGIGFILLIAIGAGVGLFALLTRRLRVMNSTVGRFANGDLETRLIDKSDDELGQLAGSFNQMADKLVTSLKDLEQTDRLRRELIANISHDLRSPLASIQGYLERVQLKDGELSSEERREHIDVVLRNARRLNDLVGQLFELSKLEADQVEPEFEAFSVAELVQDLVMQFRPQAEARNVRLEAVLPERISLVRADIALVERALSNLLENSLRHTPRGGLVRVRSAEELDRVRVEVCDTGVGIAEDELPHLFDRFYRGENPRDDGSGGLGLGLAIAQRIAQLHGSSLSVSSRIGSGTTFGLDLPVAAV